jgi:DNA methylase/NACHT-associated inactive Restriction Endonuclease 1
LTFGPENFRNEIVWRRTGQHNSAKRFGPIHDVLLFYSKTDAYFFARVYRPYLRGHVESYFKHQDGGGRYWTNALTGAGTRRGDSGQPWRSYNPTAVGRHWAIPSKVVQQAGIDELLSTQGKLDALDAAGLVDHPPTSSKAMPTYRQHFKDSPGVPPQDIWAYQPHTRGVLYGTEEAIDEDVRWLVRQGDPERLGYETQKPEGMLARIINSSSREDDVVLDPFCGCGTTIAVAQRLNRQWIGIDITHLAIALIKSRLRDRFPDTASKDMYQVIGEPVTVPDAAELANEDPFQFQSWALGLVGARPHQQRKGSDKGIDGRLYFHDEGESGRTKQIVLSVKSGHVSVRDLRDLRGVIEREKAEIGVLLTLEDATKPMQTEATSAGFYKSPWGNHPRLQILTVAELLEGKGIDYPHMSNVTFKRASRAQAPEAEQLELSPAPSPKRKEQR